ncbi:MAG: phosphopantothenoylcysteine decarboxylase [Planctomycetota bacterium]|nr:phosphopantothenoylcysteine decarboxylase [Planctomycetota bacterium]
MTHIVITSGPTRQYLDPVRYLTNASSGRMGSALAAEAIALGHRVTIISGPVNVEYPQGATVVPVVTTQEMLEATSLAFASADGLIGAAAPCDYMPQHVQPQKMSKTGEEVTLRLIETPDVIATLAATKRKNQWVVGFALETEDRRFRAIVKMQKKSCDLMVSNGPTAIDSLDNDIELIERSGDILAHITGSKEIVAKGILRHVQDRLISPQ